MAGRSVVDTPAARLGAGVAVFVTMVVTAAAVAPRVRATGVPYPDLVATGVGALVAVLVVVGLSRIYRAGIDDG